MTSRKILFPVVAALMALALWWCSPGTRQPTGMVVRQKASRDSAIAPRAETRVGAANPVASGNPDTDFPLAARLNAPDSTVAADLDALGQIFDAWRTNFSREGNPVGENHEITAALRGDNPLGLALIPNNHPAINARGELCDRWGTPFRFHQLSGERMEIQSAGPDRKFGTADDALWSPGS